MKILKKINDAKECIIIMKTKDDEIYSCIHGMEKDLSLTMLVTLVGSNEMYNLVKKSFAKAKKIRNSEEYKSMYN